MAQLDVFHALDQGLAAAVAAAAPAVVHVSRGHTGGSGIVWSEELVVTSSFHTPDRTKVGIPTGDGNLDFRDAEVIGRDPGTDVALLRVTGGGLTPGKLRDPKMAPGQRARWYPWPYVEGLTMAEASNDLAFLATGAYGHPLAKVMGAPLRLAVPWKYGFKSIKSIVRFSFVEKRPVGMWEKLQASEDGFWANVNPEVPHPRWSQASEEIIGTGERRPTLLYNGYGEYVADLYKGLEKERLWA